jgi:hypothetical protein
MDRLQLQELIAGLGGAVEDFGRAGAVARGGKQDSGAFYQGLAQSAGRARDRELEDERRKQEAVRQRVLDDYKARDDARAQAKFDADMSATDMESDPNSKASVVMRSILKKNNPDLDLEGLSAKEMRALPGASAKGANKRFVNLTDDDGVVRSYIIDIDTGEKSAVGKAGYSQNTFEDPETGARAVFNPALGSARPLRGAPSAPSAAPGPVATPAPQIAGQPLPSTALRPGETPNQRDVRVGLETKEAEGKIKSEQERAGEKRASKEEIANLEMMEKELVELHKQANLTGPVLGQVGQVASALGFNPDEKAQLFSSRMQLWANDYIKKMSGSTVPADEYRLRLAPLLPTVGSSASQVASRLKGFKEYVQKNYVNKFGKDDKANAARKWLEANPNDPRAEAIRQKLGGN